jgi:micrococcal nuclease
MLKYYLFFFLILPIYCETITGKVVSVSDGDTITILDASKKQYKIRFEHIDAPEKKQPFGEKSKQFVSKLIFGKTVKVKTSIKGRYGRYIGSIYLDEVNINLEVVKAGLAWHYKRYSKDKTFAAAESLARKKKAGLWIDANPIAPWEFRRNKQ